MVCARAITSLFSRVSNVLVELRHSTDRIMLGVDQSMKASVLGNRDAIVKNMLYDFHAEERAELTAKYGNHSTFETECAGDENRTECVEWARRWSEIVDNLIVDAESVAELREQVEPGMDAELENAANLRGVGDEYETQDWLDSATARLWPDTRHGVGCPDVPCAGLASCISAVVDDVSQQFAVLGDERYCPRAHGGNDKAVGVCDAAIAGQAAGKRWDALAPQLKNAFKTAEVGKGSGTLAAAEELISRARDVLGALSPLQLCGVQHAAVNADHVVEAAGVAEAQLPPRPPLENGAFNQMPSYSSMCAGSVVSLTDGSFETESSGIPPFTTCIDDSAPSVEVPLLHLSTIESVKVGKQCKTGAMFDDGVEGLQVVLKTPFGPTPCGTPASVDDARCGAETPLFWERRCEVSLPVIAVVLLRTTICDLSDDSNCTGVASAISTTEIQALGRPNPASTNVLLGQRVEASSQCHEDPTLLRMNRHTTEIPSVIGQWSEDANTSLACLERCRMNTRCVAVSFAPPVDMWSAATCVLSPEPLGRDDITWTLSTDSRNRTTSVEHWSKSITIRHLQSLDGTGFEGDILGHFCVDDLGGCKQLCAMMPRCSGFTLYGDVLGTEGANTSAVCAIAGAAEDSAVRPKAFAEGPFSRLPQPETENEFELPAWATELQRTTDSTLAFNYETATGVTAATDGAFQRSKTADGVGANGFFHTCGDGATDFLVVHTPEPTAVHTVRVHRRCDCCAHRSVGLLVQQLTVDTDGFSEWRACGELSSELDAVCVGAGPGSEFWERACDLGIATIAIRVVRKIVPNVTQEYSTDSSPFSLDIDEIEAFGAPFKRPFFSRVNMSAIEDDEPDNIVSETFETNITTDDLDDCATVEPPELQGHERRRRDGMDGVNALFTGCSRSTVNITSQKPTVPRPTTPDGGDGDGDDINNVEPSSASVIAGIVVSLLILIAIIILYVRRKRIKRANIVEVLNAGTVLNDVGGERGDSSLQLDQAFAEYAAAAVVLTGSTTVDEDEDDNTIVLSGRRISFVRKDSVTGSNHASDRRVSSGGQGTGASTLRK